MKKFIALSSLLLLAGITLMSCNNSSEKTIDSTTQVTPTPTPTSTPTSTTSSTPTTSIEPQKEVLDFEWDGETIPSNFDLRNVDCDGDGIPDRCYVTSVKLQNPYGTCWGFAAIAAAEISLLGSVYSTDPTAYEWLDLSEKQLAYFSHMPLNDETSTHNSEGQGPAKENYTMSDIYTGGSSFMATGVFAQGIGPTNENDPRVDELFKYYGNNKIVTERYIDDGFHYFSYSSDDDWTIPEEYRFIKDYNLTEGRLLPLPADKDSEGNYKYNENATIETKKQLLLKKGVNVAFFADTSNPNQAEGKQGKYISYNWAHYTYDENTGANHAVTIVGWDDNYSSTNFVDGHQPEGNGAWLVKNSWGSGENEFPNKGTGGWGIPVEKKDEDGNTVLDENGDPVMVGSGYFWLSYYDKSITCIESFDFTDELTPEVIDQYDFVPSNGLVAEEINEETKMANVFQAKYSEYLTAISCQTSSENAEVHYDIYLLPDDFNSPEDGLKVASGDNTYRFGGFHRIELIDPILIQKYQNYSIVVTIKQGDKYLMNTQYGIYLQYKMNQKAIINEGESFLYFDGLWGDYKPVAEFKSEQMTSSFKILFGVDSLVTFDNFPIKGYTVKEFADTHINLNLNNSTLYLVENSNEAKAVLTFDSYSYAELGNVNINWEIIEGSDFIDLIPDTKLGNSTATIKAKEVGEALIAIDADIYGYYIFKIKVAPIYPYYVAVYPLEVEKVYTGNEITPQLIVATKDLSELKEDVHYTLTFENNINCGLATITAIGIGDAVCPEGMELPKDYFVIKPTKAQFETVEFDGNDLKVKVIDLYTIGATGYKLEYRLAGTEEWTVVELNNGAVDYTINNLADGQYEVRVCAFVNVPKISTETTQIAGTYKGEYSSIVTLTK